MQVGVTGGIGSGKSLVCKIFTTLGIPVYNADDRAKELMVEDPGLRKAIIQIFGSNSYSEKGELNRKYLANLVFRDQGNLNKINNLVHPIVADDYNDWASMNEEAHPYIIKEAALLFESGSYRELNAVTVVTAPEELRIKRVLSRDPHRDRNQVVSIISKQLPEEELVKKSDHVIINDESQPLIQQVLDLHHKLIEKSGR